MCAFCYAGVSLSNLVNNLGKRMPLSYPFQILGRQHKYNCQKLKFVFHLETRSYFGCECIEMLCQSFPCLPSDPTLLLRGLAPAKDIPRALYPLVSVRCNQLGWSRGILVGRKKRKARAIPSQPPVITSSTGSKFSFYLTVPPASMSQLLQTGL